MSVMENKRAELEKLIEKAIKKINGHKENDLCKYLPGPSGGYMHHFTMRKLKHDDPTQLFALLQEYIVSHENPLVLPPKSRAPRGSRKQYHSINFSRTDMEKVLDLARKTGDRDLIARFSPKRSLPLIKKELIRSIRHHQIHQELWDYFVEAVGTEKSE
jgi:hypothetical protein